MPFSREQAHEVGALVGKAGVSDVVDAHLVVTAAKTSATVLTSDPEDLGQLSSHLRSPVTIRPI